MHSPLAHAGGFFSGDSPWRFLEEDALCPVIAGSIFLLQPYCLFWFSGRCRFPGPPLFLWRPAGQRDFLKKIRICVVLVEN